MVDCGIMQIDRIGRFRFGKKEVFNIYEHFHAINREKQERILNAAFREFGRHGFKKTSVRQIVESAGIAKGMLFHYFGNKLGLYEYLFSEAYEFIRTFFGDVTKQIQVLDYIEQYSCTTKTKLRAYTANPYIFEFFTMLFIHPENIEVSEKVKSLYEEILSLRNQVLYAISSAGDTSRFRDDMDENRIKEYISWVVEGYSNDLLKKLDLEAFADIDLDPYWVEFDVILADLKKLFYKNKEGV